MAQYTERLWTQTKDTEQLTFIAGVDLPYRELVKESGPNTNIMVVATTVDAIGYVLSPKGVLAGEKVDVQMLYGRPGGGGGGGAVNSVTGLAPNVIVDNTDPTNPIVAAGTQSWEFSGIITTPLLNGAQNNYTQAGMVDASTIRVYGDLLDPPIFSGFAGGTNGRILIIHNASQDTPIYFLHNSASSTAANRIMSPGFVVDETFWTLPVNGMAILQYDATDSRWRVIGNYVYKIIDDGSGVVTVGGDPQFPIVGFNGVFVNAPITGNGTSGSPLSITGLLTDIEINRTMYVDSFYGDDTTAISDSLVLKYKTIGAALIDWTPGKTIHLFPGKYNMTTPFAINNGELKIYMEPGAELGLLTVSSAFVIDGGQKLNITGPGDITCTAPIFEHSNTSTILPAELVIDVQRIVGSFPNTSMGSLDGMNFSIDALYIFNLYPSGAGWCKGSISVDDWITNDIPMLQLRDFTSSNGEDYFTTYGPQKISISGKTRDRCQYRNESALISSGIYTQNGVESYKTFIDLYVDFDCTDAIGFMNCNRGTIKHYGDLVHRKTDTAGNEMPWFFMSEDPSERFKPIFEHVEGHYISGTHPSYGASLNNEIMGISKLCDVILNGAYQNAGEQLGGSVGIWPILLLRNQSSVDGTTTVILNGDFKSDGGGVAPIQFIDSGSPAHVFKIISKDTLIRTRFDYSIDTNLAFEIFVFHSLAMNTNYNPLITDGMSEDRTMVDTNVEVTVPGYGV